MSDGGAAERGQVPLFCLRPYCAETDRAFVHGTWLASNRYAPASQGLPHLLYEAEERPRIAAMVRESQVMVAHAPGEETALMGFAAWAYRPTVDRVIVHQVYVSKPARRLGIARALLEHLAEHPAWMTHLPVIRTNGRLPVPKGWRFNRYLIEGAPHAVQV